MFTKLFGLIRRDTEVEDNKVSQFLKELMPQFDEGRKHRRVSFSRATTIYFDGEPVPVPAMIRDISLDGIGLLHVIPIDPGEVTLRILSECGKTICARVNIRRCCELIRHYYASGGEYIRVFEDDPFELDVARLN